MPTKLIPASEAEIRALAHKFWEEDGRPEGQAELHWQRACEALNVPAKSAAPKAASSAPTKASKKKSS